MKKLSQLLQKHVRRSFSSGDLEKQLVKHYLRDWTIQKQTLPVTTFWDLVEASVILQGVANKLAIERAYIKIMDGMENYWSVLDYQERVRILNIDLKPVYDTLPVFMWNENPIAMPFFDERFNAMYQQEMVMFGLKQYHNLTHDYAACIQDVQLYDLAYYDGVYVPTRLVMRQGHDYVLYHPGLHVLLARYQGDKLVFPLFELDEGCFEVPANQQMELAALILSGDVEEFMNTSESYHLYQKKTVEAIRKKWKRKRIFF